jgi:hypothetical protein
MQIRDRLPDLRNRIPERDVAVADVSDLDCLGCMRMQLPVRQSG